MQFSNDTMLTSNADEVRYNCPFCQKIGKDKDDKHKLYANFKKGVFHCFRCGSSGSISLLNEFYNTGIVVSGGRDISEVRDQLSKKLNNKIKTFDLDEISWPMTKDTPLAYDYMRRRGFSDQDMMKYSIRVGKEYFDEELDREIYRWKGRIIFPFIENNRVTYLIGRTYTNDKNKYINSKGSKASVVYGMDTINSNRCIINEGIINSIVVNKFTKIGSVALLGKIPSRFQLSKLRNKVNEVYTSFDGDVTRIEKNKANRILLKMGFKVWEINLPIDRDADDLQGEYLNYFRQARRVMI